LTVWNDFPEQLIKSEVHAHPTVTPIEPRSFHPLISPFGPIGPYLTLTNRNHWNGKPLFPDLKLFPPVSDPSSSTDKQNRFSRQTPEFGRPYIQTIGTYPRSTLKWSSEDIENYFTQMRLGPRDGNKAKSDPILRPTVNRSENMNPRYEHASPAPTETPNETDGSISGESLDASAGSQISVAGTVGSNIPDRNKVVLDRIRKGLDKRTTIMVKNVPNKYTQVPTYLSLLI